MAFPTVEFNSIHPFLVKGGIETELHLSVATNTVGKSQLSLVLSAPSCRFLDGSQEIIQEIETSRADELLEMALSIVIISDKMKKLVIRLIAEVVNADGESDKSRLLVHLDNREGLDGSTIQPASSPGAMVAAAPPLEPEVSPEAVPDIVASMEVEEDDGLERIIPHNSEVVADTATDSETDAANSFEAIVSSTIELIATGIPDLNLETDSNSTTKPA